VVVLLRINLIHDQVDIPQPAFRNIHQDKKCLDALIDMISQLMRVESASLAGLVLGVGLEPCLKTRRPDARVVAGDEGLIVQLRTEVT
jgi:hypothetical protein